MTSRLPIPTESAPIVERNLENLYKLLGSKVQNFEDFIIRLGNEFLPKCWIKEKPANNNIY